MSSKKRPRAEVTGIGSSVSGEGSRTKRAPVQKAKDLDVVLKKCRDLKSALREKEAKRTHDVVPESVRSDEIVEVAELSTAEVLEGIEGVALSIANQVLARKGFTLDVPSRSASNQIYVKEWDRIVLGGKRLTRNFINVRVSLASSFLKLIFRLRLRWHSLLHPLLMTISWYHSLFLFLRSACSREHTGITEISHYTSGNAVAVFGFN